MRKTLVCLALLTAPLTLMTAGCATKRCVEEYSTMPRDQVIRGDGELLTQLVDTRQEAAEALQALSEGSSERSDLVFSVQALEMGIRLIIQLQNLSRRDEHSGTLEAQSELITNIRCTARRWAVGEDHTVSTRDGQRMLTYQRELETHFGEQGRPSDSQLTAIVEGREIYMGPVEEEIDVSHEDDGTGPGDESGEESDEEPGEDDEVGSAVDDLLGEETEEEDDDI